MQTVSIKTLDRSEEMSGIQHEAEIKFKKAILAWFDEFYMNHDEDSEGFKFSGYFVMDNDTDELIYITNDLTKTDADVEWNAIWNLIVIEVKVPHSLQVTTFPNTSDLVSESSGRYQYTFEVCVDCTYFFNELIAK